MARKLGKSRNKIIDLAKSVNNGDVIRIFYEREVKTYKKLTSKKFYKLSEIEVVYDERTYFQQLREENGINVLPTLDPQYTHIAGCLYAKIDNPEKLYIRIVSPVSRIDKEAVYFDEENEVKYEDIEEFLQASERKGYKCNDLQTSTGAAGHTVEDRVQPINYILDKVIEFEIVR